MAPEERDRSFDKGLRRHLRSSTPFEGARNAPANPALRRDLCPDAETRAAYHERSLLPDEMNSWKEHIIGCAHCQMILTQLQATDEIPLEGAKEEEVLAIEESASVMVERKVEELTTLAAQRQSLRAAEETRASRLSRGVRWRWLAPAGAIAAGLLVWIALHENQPLRFPTTVDTQIAKQAPPRPTPPPLGQQPAPAPQAHAALRKPSSTADEIASLNARASSEAPKQLHRSEAQAESKTAVAKGSADKESGTRKDAAHDSLGEPSIAAGQVDLDSRAIPGAMAEKAELQTQMQARAREVQSQNQYSYNAPKVPGPGPLNQVEATKKMRTPAPPSAATPVSGTAGRLQGATSMMEPVTASNPRLIAVAGSTVVWRAGRAGTIEFSSDGGKSWSRQTSGVIVDLLTGSAPSEKTCWIVGRTGTILRTTDGGAHWQKVRSPVQADLGSVFAVDAQQATVSPAHGSYQTTDGGLTWNKLAPE